MKTIIKNMIDYNIPNLQTKLKLFSVLFQNNHK